MLRPASTRRTDDLFRLLVDGVHDHAITLLDASGHVTTWNRGAERITGYAEREALGRHLSSFYPEADARTGRPEFELRAARERGALETDGPRLRRDGTEFLASVVITALGEVGAPWGYVVVTRDVTERRRAEEARRQLAVARDAIRARDEFLTIASHELKTPLTAVLLQLQALDRWAGSGDLPEKQRGRIASSLRSVERLAALVRQLLEVSRLTAGHLQLERAPGDLVSLAEEVVLRREPQARAFECAVSVSAPGPVPGSWDGPRIADALGAVLDNALKYGAGKPVIVSVWSEGDRARISVRDEGPGIPPEHHARIFERFERAAPTVHYGGFGIGLWAARQIATAHGGEIVVDSAVGRGATFILTLPAR